MKTLTEYINQINEDGIYKGCEELALYIKDLIVNNQNKKLFVVDSKDLNFQNIFFDTLYIEVTINEEINEKIIAGKYHIEDDPTVSQIIRWNYEEKKFSYIKLNIKLDNYEDIDHTIIGHELNHAYEDYNIRKDSNNKKSINSYKDEKYDNAVRAFEYGQFSEKIVGFIEYVSTGTETRAFVAQAMMKLKQNIAKYSTFDEALKKQLEMNSIFQQYTHFNDLFNRNKNNKITKAQLCKVYRKINTNCKFTDDKIIKTLENKLSKYYKALTKHINIILIDYAKENA